MEKKEYVFNENGVCLNGDILFQHKGKKYEVTLKYAFVDGRYHFSHDIYFASSGGSSPLMVDDFGVSDFGEGARSCFAALLQLVQRYREEHPEIGCLATVLELEEMASSFGKPKHVQMQLF